MTRHESTERIVDDFNQSINNIEATGDSKEIKNT